MNNESITKTPGVCGGQARIRNTRIEVWVIVSLVKKKASYEEILRNYPDLTSEDIDNALRYYQENQDEIDGILN